MLQEYRDSQNLMPEFILKAIRNNDAQTILAWLGSPADEGKGNSAMIGGYTMLHMTAISGFAELANLLLQDGAAVDIYDSVGSTPILTALMKSHHGLVDETVALLYEWGASLQHHLPGEKGALTDTFIAKTPVPERARQEALRDHQPEPAQGSHWPDVHRRKVHGQEESV